MNRRKHWESVYQSKREAELGWYKRHLDISLGLIRESGVGMDARLIDVGGGASTLVDDLLETGFANVSVLDVSEAAIKAAESRLGSRAQGVNWIHADITSAALPTDYYDLWHDRAVFHFLTSEEDRALYVQKLRSSLRGDGHVVIGSFSLSGPRKCSGLRVVRYSSESLQGELGTDEFDLVTTEEELHRTPSGVVQHYIYCRFRRNKPSSQE